MLDAVTCEDDGVLRPRFPQWAAMQSAADAEARAEREATMKKRGVNKMVQASEGHLRVCRTCRRYEELRDGDGRCYGPCEFTVSESWCDEWEAPE